MSIVATKATLCDCIYHALFFVYPGIVTDVLVKTSDAAKQLEIRKENSSAYPTTWNPPLPGIHDN